MLQVCPLTLDGKMGNVGSWAEIRPGNHALPGFSQPSFQYSQMIHSSPATLNPTYISKSIDPFQPIQLCLPETPSPACLPGRCLFSLQNSVQIFRHSEVFHGPQPPSEQPPPDSLGGN